MLEPRARTAARARDEVRFLKVPTFLFDAIPPGDQQDHQAASVTLRGICVLCVDLCCRIMGVGL